MPLLVCLHTMHCVLTERQLRDASGRRSFAKPATLQCHHYSTWCMSSRVKHQALSRQLPSPENAMFAFGTSFYCLPSQHLLRDSTKAAAEEATESSGNLNLGKLWEDSWNRHISRQPAPVTWECFTVVKHRSPRRSSVRANIQAHHHHCNLQPWNFVSATGTV